MQNHLAHTTLFEVSWEVCNKVGGIHAVVSSKALQATEQLGGRYFMIGPDLGNNDGFEETNEPGWDLLRQAVTLRNLSCRFGRWNIPGRPKTILVSFKDRFNANQLLYELWTRYGVDSLTGGWDYTEPVMFSTVCGEVITAIYQASIEPVGGTAAAHFHEWMCGAGLLTVKRLAPQIGTVFTTHATMLGRAMAGAGCDIYKQMRQINPQREAAAYNITAKCSMERVSAREADCFTTVSHITADEATTFLARTPDVLTPNGLDLRVIPNYVQQREKPLAHRNKIVAATAKLLRRTLPANIHLMIISGRYEFHNKGVDLFLEALAHVNESLRGSNNHILALCAVMGGHSGVNPDAVGGDPAKKPAHGEHWISSHQVYDSPNDPILNMCARLGLDNRAENNVQVIFVPALLDGNDGFLNLTYDETLAACELGVFPSWYEPWGYTPQESAAWAVPTVTTDLSGFGMWTRENQERLNMSGGVTVLPRRNVSYEEAEAALRATLLQTVAQAPEKLEAERRAARSLIEHCSWEHFFPHYTEAYAHALEKAEERTGQSYERNESIKHLINATSSATPVLRGFMAVSYLPTSLRRLRELANNLWWCWHAEARSLFADIDPMLWDKCEHNPVCLLATVSSKRLLEVAHDADYMERFNQVMAEFDAYMAEPVAAVDATLSSDRPIAYFSTEYGISECLPIYSGGLGVLSGDHLKSSSDLNIPLVAVGLLYKSGYFRQRLNSDGRQVATYPENDFTKLPIERVIDANGEPVEVVLDLPGRQLHAQAWLAHVGRIKLYLLDTDTPKNTDSDRKTTARLYEADRDCRLRQEILLGMGGVRLLSQLHIIPGVYHMNEGHSAFLIFERIRILMQQHGLSFEAACEVVRGSCVFTTHTPVDAGNERFSMDLIERYFTDFANTVGLPWGNFVGMGTLAESDRSMFEMTVLALNYSFKANGVSRLHGDVSRHMWHNGWKGYSVMEVPITHVTNGVHVPSYAGPAIRPILDETLGQGWMNLPPESPIWGRVANIPDERLWEARQAQKAVLLRAVAAGLPAMFKTLGVSRQAQRTIRERLNPTALVVGFARRFAPYKRANLLFADPDRLHRILNDANRPIIFIFAGKAHPADTQGIDIMQEVVKHTLDPRFQGRIFFMEDYSLAVSRLLTQGCDVWLNTPRRPYEASGTSGMKLSVNGGVNLSISDGWWCEGYNGKNGWTIGPVVERLQASDNQDDYADAESLYTLLEESVIPSYFEHDENGLPHAWLERSRNAMQTLTAQFSSNRMVSDYMHDYYAPTAKRQHAMRANSFELPAQLAEWKFMAANAFPSVRIEEVFIEGVDADTVLCGQAVRMSVTIAPGELNPDNIRVELVVGHSDGHDFTEVPAVAVLEEHERLSSGSVVFVGDFAPTANGYHAFGVRVVPNNPMLNSAIETRLVLWA